jgi:hypothetical protein
MTLNPAVQSRAQAEIDAVMCFNNDTAVRLPTFADRECLPYVNAIVKEVLRWNPSVPLGESSKAEKLFCDMSAGRSINIDKTLDCQLSFVPQACPTWLQRMMSIKAITLKREQ